MIKTIHAFWHEELGTTLIDYILIAAIVGVAAFVAMDNIGGSVTQFVDITDERLRVVLEIVSDPDTRDGGSDGSSDGGNGEGNNDREDDDEDD